MSEKEKKKAEELSDVFKDLGNTFRIGSFADFNDFHLCWNKYL